MRLASSLVLAALAGCVPPANVDEQQAPIIGGSTDTGDPAVVLIMSGNPNGGSVGLCTGEIISPHVVLTAGHCSNESGPWNIYLGSDLNRLRPSDLLPGVAHHHPNYPNTNTGNAPMNYDIGVIVMNDAITGITPLPFNTGNDPTTMVGQAIRFVGYGSTGSVSPSDTSAGTKRQTTTTLSRVLTRLLEFDDSQHATCEGDSGGPAFAMINGVETIIGVTSIGGQQGSRCVGGGDDTRVDLYTDFIQPFIDQNDPPPPTQPGQTPSPGSVGASCSDNTQCNSKICADAPNGYCTATCDPYKSANACPSGMSCMPLGPEPASGYVCEKDKRSNNGCSVSSLHDGAGANGLLLLIGGALLLFALRRRRIA